MRIKTRKKSQGYVLFEAADYVVIATGIVRKSANRKTGRMIQIYIINRHVHPAKALQDGSDSVVCLDCIHRPRKVGKGKKAKRLKRSCYVPMNGVISVFNAYKRGNYPVLSPEDYEWVFGGRAVRLGTYGEPVLIPLSIIRMILRYCERHSGYTHQWEKGIDGEFMQYLMASCDTPGQAERARALGYRYFRVTPEDDAEPTMGEVVCPSETRGHNCVDCKLCNGAVNGAKSVIIPVHGTGKTNFASNVQLIQIGLAA